MKGKVILLLPSSESTGQMTYSYLKLHVLLLFVETLQCCTVVRCSMHTFLQKDGTSVEEKGTSNSSDEAFRGQAKLIKRSIKE